MAADQDRDDEAPGTSAASPHESAPSDEMPMAPRDAESATPDGGPSRQAASPATSGETREQPPADDQIGQTLDGKPNHPFAETEIRPVPPEVSRPDNVGPGSTGIMPPVDVPGTPRWSARAPVRTPEIPEEEPHDWAEAPRGLFVPILVTVCILLLVALVGLGSWLIFASRPSGAPAPTPTVQNATPPATTGARTATTPVSVAPTEIPLPDVRGLDYETAAAKLTALGFTPVRRDEIDGAVPKGKVIGTDPPAGTPVRPGPGVRINIRVSLGLPETTRPAESPTSSAGPP
jgi:PASTA domain